MLHILNGDSLLGKFKNSNIGGSYIPWRECLMEGPVLSTTSSEEFWNVRAQYINTIYNRPKDEYKKYIKNLFTVLNNLSESDEIILWFDYDLFCQINLMCLLKLFAEKNLTSKVSLICINDHPETSNFKGLVQLSTSQLENLLDQRKTLSKKDLCFAQRFWNSYTDQDPTSLENFLGEDFTNFPFLKDAIVAHLKRFPSVENGLNIIENAILKAITSGVVKDIDLLSYIWSEFDIYGFGDLQIINYRENLRKAKLINHNKILSITELGKEIMDGNKNYLDIARYDFRIGGVHLSNETSRWQWDKTKQRLV